MTAAASRPREHADGQCWEETIWPRLSRGDDANEVWWTSLPTADPELAETVRHTLKQKLGDINDQLGQRGAAYEAGQLSDGEFFLWRGRALGFKRVVTRRLHTIQVAIAAATATAKAEGEARRSEAARADIARQSAAAAAKAARRAWLEQAEAEHGRAVRSALLDLALGVDQHRRETGADATEVDRLLWAALGRLTMPATGPDTESETLETIVDRIQTGRAGKGKAPVDALRATQ